MFTSRLRQEILSNISFSPALLLTQTVLRESSGFNKTLLKRRNEHVIITSKRRFDVIIMCLLRFVFARMCFRLYLAFCSFVSLSVLRYYQIHSLLRH